MTTYEGIYFLNPPTEAEKRALTHFFNSLRAEINLPKREKQLIIEDFRALLRYYKRQGLDMVSGVERIGSNILGGFYTERESEWYPLDSAAKVYPLYMTKSKMSVYRVSAYLKTDVQPVVLQVALLSCLKRFPLFATSIRNGCFWHYIDALNRRFEISEEKFLPCVPINVSTRRSPSFRVGYFGKRISLEVFHILTDGTGAMVFLKTLVREYNRLMGIDMQLAEDVLDVNERPDCGELEDAFIAGSEAERAEGFFEPKAPQLKGRRTQKQPAGVSQLIMSASLLKSEAEKRKTTVTALMLTLIFLAIDKSIKIGCTGSPAVQVPVNMRNYYSTKTLRNYSMYAVIKLRRDEISDLPHTLAVVKKRLNEGVDKSSLDRMIAMTNKLVSNIALRLAPLSLKRLVFKRVYKMVGEKTITTTFSNLGMVTTDFAGTVDMLDFILGPSGTNKVCCAMISYRDTAVLSLTHSTKELLFENEMCNLLKQLKIPVEIRRVGR